MLQHRQKIQLIGYLTLSFGMAFQIGCTQRQVSADDPLQPEEMIKIAKKRDCYSYFGNSSLDVCIFRMAPYFDQLTPKDREIVIANFILYGNLDAGSAVAFSQLIYPYKTELKDTLNQYSDQQLMKIYNLPSRHAQKYRKELEYFLQNTEPRRKL